MLLSIIVRDDPPASGQQCIGHVEFFNGQLQFAGDVTAPHIAGVLGGALELISQQLNQPRSSGNGGRIIVPQVQPPRDLKGGQG